MVLKLCLSSFYNYCEMYHTIASTMGDGYLQLPSPTVLCVFNYHFYLCTLHKLCVTLALNNFISKFWNSPILLLTSVAFYDYSVYN